MCKNGPGNGENRSVPSEVTSRYPITKSNQETFDGPVPNNGATFVRNVKDAQEIVIEDALMHAFVGFPLHSMKQRPEKNNEPTSLPGEPDPITEKCDPWLTVTLEFEISTKSMLETPFEIA
jgi:hypothetical protein